MEYKFEKSNSMVGCLVVWLISIGTVVPLVKKYYPAWADMYIILVVAIFSLFVLLKLFFFFPPSSGSSSGSDPMEGKGKFYDSDGNVTGYFDKDE